MSQEIDSEVIDLVKQKGFDPYYYMSSLKKKNADKNECYI